MKINKNNFLFILFWLFIIVLVEKKTPFSFFDYFDIRLFVVRYLLIYFLILGILVFILYFVKLNYTSAFRSEAKNIVALINNSLGDEIEKEIKIKKNQSGKTVCQINIAGRTLSVQNFIDVLIIKNIFINRNYGLIVNFDSVVIDVGSNVGYSVLWFAANPSIKHVYGFEPIEENFLRATEHLDLNPEIRHKIHLRNCGLGTTSAKKQMDFLPNHHTISSTSIQKQKTQGVAHKIVKVEAADQIFNAIARKASKDHHKIILKIDCEGCEHDILEGISKEVWDQVMAVMVEVHGKDCKSIIRNLENHGFMIFAVNKKTNVDFGQLMDIYGVKNEFKQHYTNY